MAAFQHNALSFAAAEKTWEKKPVLCLTLEQPPDKLGWFHAPWGDAGHRAEYAAPSHDEIAHAVYCLRTIGGGSNLPCASDVRIVCAHGHNRSNFLCALLNWWKREERESSVDFTRRFVSEARSTNPSAFGLERWDQHKSPAFVYQLLNVAKHGVSNHQHTLAPGIVRIAEAKDTAAADFTWCTRAGNEQRVRELPTGRKDASAKLAIGCTSEELRVLWASSSVLVIVDVDETRACLAERDPSAARPYEAARPFRCQYRHREADYRFDDGLVAPLYLCHSPWFPEDGEPVLLEPWVEAFKRYGTCQADGHVVPLFGALEQTVWVLRARCFRKRCPRAAFLEIPAAPPMADPVARQLWSALFGTHPPNAPASFRLPNDKTVTFGENPPADDFVLLTLDINANPAELRDRCNFMLPVSLDLGSLAHCEKQLSLREEATYCVFVGPAPQSADAALLTFWLYLCSGGEHDFETAARFVRTNLNGAWFGAGSRSSLAVAALLCEARREKRIPPRVRVAEATAAIDLAGAMVLDVGAGEGQAILNSTHFNAKGLRGVTAIEPCPAQRKRFQREANQRGAEIGDLQFRDSLADLPEATFDVCLVSMAAHHLTAEDWCAVARAVKKSGALILSAPIGHRIVAYADACSHWGKHWLRSLHGCKDLSLELRRNGRVVFAADDVTREGSDEPLCFLTTLEAWLNDAGFVASDWTREPRCGAFKLPPEDGVAGFFACASFRRTDASPPSVQPTPPAHDPDTCIYCRKHAGSVRAKNSSGNSHKKINRDRFNDEVGRALRARAAKTPQELPDPFRRFPQAPLNAPLELLSHANAAWSAWLGDTRLLPVQMPPVAGENWMRFLAKHREAVEVASKDDGFRAVLLVRPQPPSYLFDRAFNAYEINFCSENHTGVVLDGELLVTEGRRQFLWHSRLDRGKEPFPDSPYIRRKKFVPVTSEDAKSVSAILQWSEKHNHNSANDGLVFRCLGKCPHTIKDKPRHSVDLFCVRNKKNLFLFCKKGEFAGILVVAANETSVENQVVECAPHPDTRGEFPMRWIFLRVCTAPEKKGPAGANAWLTLQSSLAAGNSTPAERLQAIRLGCHVFPARAVTAPLVLAEEKALDAIVTFSLNHSNKRHRDSCNAIVMYLSSDKRRAALFAAQLEKEREDQLLMTNLLNAYVEGPSSTTWSKAYEKLLPPRDRDGI